MSKQGEKLHAVIGKMMGVSYSAGLDHYWISHIPVDYDKESWVRKPIDV